MLMFALVLFGGLHATIEIFLLAAGALMRITLKLDRRVTDLIFVVEHASQ